jgi:phosphate transport system protein
MAQRKTFDQGLEEMARLLVEMGSGVARVLSASMKALESVDVPAARQIVASDAEMNRLEEKVIEVGTRLIATQQPVAKDLRRILIAFRIASDLERMADLSVDIAKTVIRLEGQTYIKPPADLVRMSELVLVMIQASIQSYMDEDMDLACKMAGMDDQVDEIYAQILRDLFMRIADHPQAVGQVMLLGFVGRYMERIADHATNIGEDVVYLLTGKRPDLNQ